MREAGSKASVKSKLCNDLQRTSTVSLKRQFASTPKASTLAQENSAVKSSKKPYAKTNINQ